MNEVTVANFRCFRDPQSARLAPLTLLVGDNSTGKTSFLALVRALWNVAFRERAPDFKEPPYDLGSFQEIVHISGDRAHQAPGFTAGFRMNVVSQPHVYPSAEGIEGPIRFQMTFEKDSSAPSLVVRRIDSSEHWIEDATAKHQAPSFSFGTTFDEWTIRAEALPMLPWDGTGRDLSPLSMLFNFTHAAFRHNRQDVVSTRNTRPDKRDWEACESLSWMFRHYPHFVFAAAPVRSQPRRTYDPARLARDSEGALHSPCTSLICFVVTRENGNCSSHPLTDSGDLQDCLKKSMSGSLVQAMVTLFRFRSGNTATWHRSTI